MHFPLKLFWLERKACTWDETFLRQHLQEGNDRNVFCLEEEGTLYIYASSLRLNRIEPNTLDRLTGTIRMKRIVDKSISSSESGESVSLDVSKSSFMAMILFLLSIESWRPWISKHEIQCLVNGPRTHTLANRRVRLWLSINCRCTCMTADYGTFQPLNSWDCTALTWITLVCGCYNISINLNYLTVG